MCCDPEFGGGWRGLTLPKNMLPGKDAFEALGFVFRKGGSEEGYQVTLPREWEAVQHDVCVIILKDEKNRERGRIFYATQSQDSREFAELYIRYHVTYDWVDPGAYRVSAKDFDDTILFVAGTCKTMVSSRYNELIKKAQEYLDNRYPGWNDPSKHWD